MTLVYLDEDEPLILLANSLAYTIGCCPCDANIFCLVGLLEARKEKEWPGDGVRGAIRAAEQHVQFLRDNFDILNGLHRVGGGAANWNTERKDNGAGPNC
jgi:hypothetical protein